MFIEDLSIFYNASEFAVTCQKQANGAPAGAAFSALLSEADEEAMQGYVVGTVRELRYPTAAVTLQKGDLLTSQYNAAGATPGPVASWRVLREGYRVNDGAESVAYLTTTTTTIA